MCCFWSTTKMQMYFPMKILLVTEFPSLPSPLLYLPKKANKKKGKEMCKIFINTNLANRDCKLLMNCRAMPSFPIAEQPQAA